MKNLQVFIIIFSALLVSYTCVPDFLITANINSFYVDLDSSRQSVLTASKYDTPDKTILFSECSGHLYIFSDVGTPDIQLDADIPEAPELYDHAMTLMASALEETPILTAGCSATKLFHFPSEAYRLRI
jgi:hypothetical protein